jgi:hypothetical protein
MVRRLELLKGELETHMLVSLRLGRSRLMVEILLNRGTHHSPQRTIEAVMNAKLILFLRSATWFSSVISRFGDLTLSVEVLSLLRMRPLTTCLLTRSRPFQLQLPLTDE